MALVAREMIRRERERTVQHCGAAELVGIRREEE